MAKKRSRLRRSAGVAAIVISLVAAFEGLRTVAYEDPISVPTICFGETRGVEMGDTATVEECHEMLGNSLAEFSAGIDACLPPGLPDRTYAAFLSAAYNIGIKAFCGSSMARRARAGDLHGACDALPLWNKVTIAGRKVALPGLTRRRAEERELCLEGVEGLAGRSLNPGSALLALESQPWLSLAAALSAFGRSEHSSVVLPRAVVSLAAPPQDQ